MTGLLHLDPVRFRGDFDRRAFTIGHQLSNHPLFELERIARLAQTLSPANIEYNAGDLPVGQDPDLTPQNGLTIEETIRRIETCGSWMVLKHVQHDPEFGAVLDACLDEIGEASEALQPGMRQRAGFLFVSSPGAVTPFHMDPELNFLLQIRGDKVLRVWDPADRTVLPEAGVEAYFASSQHRNLEYRDEHAAGGTAIPLSPGVGVHVPMAAPHWVSVGESYSVSLSITFATEHTQRRIRLHQINARLRRLGLSPSPWGRSALRDRAKLALDVPYQSVRDWWQQRSKSA